MSISDDVSEEAVMFFYTNLVCPNVPEGTKPILRSHILDIPVEFPVAYLCDILGLPNKGGNVFLSSFDKLFAVSKTESKVFSKVLLSYIDGERIITALN